MDTSARLDGSWKQKAEPVTKTSGGRRKIAVDPEKLDQLEKAIDGVKRAVRALR